MTLRVPISARSVATAGIVTLVSVLSLAACSGGAADTTVAVTGTDTECTLAKTELPAGKIDLEFTNDGDKVSELYVLTEDEEIKGEVENVGPGTTRTLSVDLVAGEYLARCKPGQTGDGITTEFMVTGEGGTVQAKPDRTITFDAVDFTYEDLDLSSVTTGETIRFEMTNAGDQPHEFEVLNPDGDPIGEVAAVEPGKSGTATITFAETGTYTYQCILIDEASGKKHTMLGMTDTFEVATK